MPLIKLLKFLGRTVFSIFRMIFVGFVTAIFCVYTVDYLTDASFGTFNIVITVVYFLLVCIFAVLFVEFFTYFQRKEKRLNVKRKDAAQYAIK